ncbi:MAG: ribonuclease III [Propionicimonas sp.]
MSRAWQLLTELGIEIDPQLYTLALTHRSYAYENGAIPHNERLEFLGDAVLGVVVTEYLYRTYPDLPEGRLSSRLLVTHLTDALATGARELGRGPVVRLGRGEAAPGAHDKPSILADSLEAVFGAVLISGGRDAADRLLRHLFDPLVDQAATMGAGLDWKTSLQEIAAELDLGLPGYRVSETGPDHDKRFTAVAVVGERTFAPGEGRSKKQAEQQAADAAFAALAADRV